MLINLTLGQNIVYSERTMGKTIGEQARLFSTLRRALIVRDAANGFVFWVLTLGSVGLRGFSGRDDWLR